MRRRGGLSGIAVAQSVAVMRFSCPVGRWRLRSEQNGTIREIPTLGRTTREIQRRGSLRQSPLAPDFGQTISSNAFHNRSQPCDLRFRIKGQGSVSPRRGREIDLRGDDVSGQNRTAVATGRSLVFRPGQYHGNTAIFQHTFSRALRPLVPRIRRERNREGGVRRRTGRENRL